MEIDSSGNLLKMKIVGEKNNGLLTSVTKCNYGYIVVGSKFEDKFNRQVGYT